MRGASKNTRSRDTRADGIAADLRRLLAGDVEFDDISRALYATDAGLNQMLPLGVVAPRDAEDVVRLVEYAAAHDLALVPRGMGSGLAGGAVGAGVHVDFTRYMNRILEVAPDGSWARVQPGVVMAWMNRELKAHGSFFAPDPSSENYCSIGGMIGTNSSGARTVAYGATKDHVLALETVLADGSVYRAQPQPWSKPGAETGHPDTAVPGAEPDASAAEDGSLGATFGGSLGGRAFAAIIPRLAQQRELIASRMPRVVKNCSGYRVESVLEWPARAAGSPGGDAGRGLAHLQRLFVGAEGTLGLVTEATLNLVPLPAQRGIAMAYFPSVFASGQAVPGILALTPTAVEIMDARFLAVVRAHDSRVDAMLPPQTDTALLIEFEGRDQGELEQKFGALSRHLADTEVLQVMRPRDAQETERLWAVRKSAVALALRMPGPRRALPFIEDVTVHPTEVPGYVDFLQRLFDRENIQAFMYGHVGDGNIHTRPLLNPKDAADLRTMERLYEEVSAYVLGMGGTMSGEHGDGLLRTPHIRRMYGDDLYHLFADIKQAFDPQGILNPGKKVGPQDDTGSLRRALRYGTEYRTISRPTVLAFEPGEYEREIEKCHGCAQCKTLTVGTMCPMYRATRREQASPRAKANLLRHIISGGLDPDSTYGAQTLKTVTDYCVVCGMCAVECPSGVNIPTLMLEAKSRYRSLHRGSVVDRVLSRAELVSRAGSAMALLANAAEGNRVLRRLAEPLVGIDHRRPVARFARPSAWTQMTHRRPAVDGHAGDNDASLPSEPSAAPTSAGPGSVAYFHDLFARYNDPELTRATLHVLQAHGLRALVPEQRASGVPEMLYGYAAAATRVAETNITHLAPLVAEGAAVVSTEPTATFALKVHYPDYVRSSDCALVANAAHDLGEFLVRYRADHPEASPAAQALGPGRRPPRRPAAAEPMAYAPARSESSASSLRVAYHLPCHLKAQQVGSPAVTLLQEIPGVEVIDLAAGCCGMAGTFGMKKGTYERSLEMGRPLFERVAEVAPDLIVSECSTCREQLAHATGFPVVHPIVLLAEAYGVR